MCGRTASNNREATIQRTSTLDQFLGGLTALNRRVLLATKRQRFGNFDDLYRCAGSKNPLFVRRGRPQKQRRERCGHADGYGSTISPNATDFGVHGKWQNPRRNRFFISDAGRNDQRRGSRVDGGFRIPRPRQDKKPPYNDHGRPLGIWRYVPPAGDRPKTTKEEFVLFANRTAGRNRAVDVFRQQFPICVRFARSENKIPQNFTTVRHSSH